MFRNSRTLAGGFAAVLVLAAALVAAFAGGSARAAGPAVFFDGGPGLGTGAPQAVLGGYNMTSFASNAPLFNTISVPVPPHCGVPSDLAYQTLPPPFQTGGGANRVMFTPTGANSYYTASCLLGGFGQGGGNTYPTTGDVWCLHGDGSCNVLPAAGASATLTPTTNTHAVAFYAMGNSCATNTFQASSGGTNSPVFTIVTACGAPGSNLPHYFGFYVLGGATVPPITITQLSGIDSGIMVGEFQNNTNKLSKIG